MMARGETRLCACGCGGIAAIYRNAAGLNKGWRGYARGHAPNEHVEIRTPTDPVDLAHAMLFQQVVGNTGRIYIADREAANATTGAGILAVLAIPTTNTLPSASATVTYAPAAFNLNDYWIGAQVNGEGCQVSVVRA